MCCHKPTHIKEILRMYSILALNSFYNILSVLCSFKSKKGCRKGEKRFGHLNLGQIYSNVCICLHWFVGSMVLSRTITTVIHSKVTTECFHIAYIQLN